MQGQETNGDLPRGHRALARYALGFRVLLLCLWLLLSVSASLLAAERTDTIQFVLSGDSEVYEDVAEAAEKHILSTCLRPERRCQPAGFRRWSVGQKNPDDTNRARLTIAFGTKATNWLRQNTVDGDKIYAMLPWQGEAFPAGPASGDNLAEIYIDQPYSRYFDLIKATIPRAARVGLLIHESNLDRVDQIEKTAQEAGFTLKTGVVSGQREVGESLSHLLNDIDVLLALPDARIHNSHTISHILTTAYRNDIPVIGFSSAYVKAGATAAVYTSLDDIAQQVADVVAEYLKTGRVARHYQLADYFSVSFNFDVARSLGLVPVSPSEIKKSILRDGE